MPLGTSSLPVVAIAPSEPLLLPPPLLDKEAAGNGVVAVVVSAAVDSQELDARAGIVGKVVAVELHSVALSPSLSQPHPSGLSVFGTSVNASFIRMRLVVYERESRSGAGGQTVEGVSRHVESMIVVSLVDSMNTEPPLWVDILVPVYILQQAIPESPGSAAIPRLERPALQ